MFAGVSLELNSGRTSSRRIPVHPFSSAVQNLALSHPRALRHGPTSFRAIPNSHGSRDATMNGFRLRVTIFVLPLTGFPSHLTLAVQLRELSRRPSLCQLAGASTT